MSKIRCSLSYHSSKVNDFPVFAGGVRDGIFNNPMVFVAPPIAQPQFQILLDMYNNTRYAYEQGGLAQKGPYIDAKEALMDALDQTADYVNTVAAGNVSTIYLSGFVPTKGNRSENPAPSVPTDVQLKRGTTGQLFAECAAQNIALSFGCILTAGAPLPDNIHVNGKGQLVYEEEDGSANGKPMAMSVLAVAMMDLNPGRKKQFLNLRPGITYYVTFFAANATGVSQLSPPVPLMCG